MGTVSYYETDYSWVWEIAGFIGAVVLAIAGFGWLLRRILGVERKKWFSPSSNFVNGFHEKVNNYFRWGNLALYVVTLAVFGFQKGALYFMVLTILIGGIQELFNAYMEKKHANNPNAYKYTLLHYPASMVILISCAGAFFPEMIDAFIKQLS
ncbi:DUF4181 domain-containing protein [Planococcus maritimus]|uniref:DUF4181 domain-containing protein n=1 Tax=Planococcus maritimus TaxID=192421 RepID=A0A7D7MEQ7_PLAMR|nr:DUF4181 domain-containing protein [Planococcus maritimus]QMT17393.1 DUF4181 domain-containing protein [Planococcus maritimus]